MNMSDQYRVNGNVQSWGSLTIKFSGEKFYGLRLFNYSDKRTRVHVYGMGAHQAPRGRSRGRYEPQNGKIGGPKGTMQDLRALLASTSPDGKSYGDVEFDITGQFIEKGDRPLIVVVERCVIVGDDSSHEESGDPLFDEMEYQPMLIRRNGLTLFDGSAGQP